MLILVQGIKDLDLVKDPGQTTNVHDREPEVAQELAAIVAKYRQAIPKVPRLGWINLKQ